MEKYAKVKQIGEGAFGKAVLVKRKQDGSHMVIKEINIIRMAAREREESRKEVAVLAQLQHPHIVAYKESFEERGSLYIVMDYCSGGDLYGKINAQKGALFSEDQVMDWFVQMCLAIKHIHDRKILHRDIKSQNIFLTSKDTVKLGDFGIAKVLNSTVELARTCIGTPYYLSPEICENKPYNNKSDIWSLGCVLYELVTLKHAFEAGNMKNLVLKIIRGSYPPISSKYSYDLRGLVAQLFKRAPRDRPSVNSVLKKPFLSQRIRKFLSGEELADEFSHTVMHGQKLARALPPPPKPAARPPSAGRRPEVAAAGAKRYDPSKIYGAPVVKRSKENRASVEVKKRPGSAGSRPGSAAGSRPGSAAGSRPGSAAGSRPSSSNQKGNPNPKTRPVNIVTPRNPNQDLQKKRLELQAKEKKRREELQKKEYEKRHKELQEKQRLARINRSREDNWKNMVGSLGSDNSEKDKREDNFGQPREDLARPKPVVRPVADVNAAGRGKYEHYHQYLDQMKRNQENKAPGPSPAYMAAPRPLPGAPNAVPVWRQAPKAPAPTPLYQPYNQRGQDHKAERARLVDDFIQRKQEAAVNKHRGQAELFGPTPDRQAPSKPAPGPYGNPPKPSAADNRNKEEQEYLEKLRQIRQQNYNERRNLQAKPQGAKYAEAEAEARKRKAEALKKQAEDWAQQKKDHLEEKRKDMLERQQRMRELRERAGVPKPTPTPMPKPAPAAPMTGALNAIGANPKMVPAQAPANKAPAMTGVMEAIGATPRMVENEADALLRPKTPIQKQKDEILRKLNSKGPPKDSSGAAEGSKDSARAQWGAGGDQLVFAEKTPETPEDGQESARSKWGAGGGFHLGQLSLEETASGMEATSARDKVICNPESARRQWGGPGQTVLNALQGAPLAEGTLSSQQSGDSFSSQASADSPAPSGKPAIGSTITISRAPIKKGTITIQPAQDTTDRDKNSSIEAPKPEPIQSANQSPEPSVLSNQESPPSPVEAGEGVSFKAVDQTEQQKPVVAERPPVPTKPGLPEKPLLLPKPVLLPKPDAPMQFGKSPVVTAVKNEGAGSLFEKVELEEEEEEKVEAGKDQTKKDNISVTDMDKEEEGIKKQTGGLRLGLTMGSFDIGHSELLRTCSEPDLSSLFRTADKDAMVRVHSLSDMSTVAEEDDDSIEDVLRSMEKAAQEKREEEEEEESLRLEMAKDDQAEDEADNEENEDEDLADLLSVRETMQSLLLDDTDDDSKKSAVKFSMSSDRESRGDTNDGDIEEDETDENQEDTSDDKKTDDDDDLAEEDGEEEEEELENGDADDVDGGDSDDDFGDDNMIPRSKSVDNENPQTPDERGDAFTEFFNTDEDSDSEFQDGEDEDFDLFGRLEESRAHLESELGAEKLIQVYKTVQALQEDEDENMEQGARIATELLGKDKEHLYPKIFQLVMADAAFTDDNLS